MAIRAKVISIKIVPTMIKSLTGGFDIYWDVQTFGFTPTFMPQYSSTEHGPWEDLVASPVATYSISEVGPKRLSFQENTFFRLKVLNGSTIVLTSAAHIPGEIMNGHHLAIYREMVRREALEIDRYNGRIGLLFRRIVYGTACSICIDETLGETSSNECTSCFGTGLAGGYYPSVALKVDWSSAPSNVVNTTLTQNGPSEVSVCEAVFPPYPEVKFKDVFADLATGQRLEIKTSVKDEYHGGTIRQIVTMSLLSPSDPAYQLPVNV